MQVGGGVSQNPQLHPTLSIARMAECDPAYACHTADTSSRKGTRAAKPCGSAPLA